MFDALMYVQSGRALQIPVVLEVLTRAGARADGGWRDSVGVVFTRRSHGWPARAQLVGPVRIAPWRAASNA